METISSPIVSLFTVWERIWLKPVSIEFEKFRPISVVGRINVEEDQRVGQTEGR